MGDAGQPVAAERLEILAVAKQTYQVVWTYRRQFAIATTLLVLFSVLSTAFSPDRRPRIYHPDVTQSVVMLGEKFGAPLLCALVSMSFMVGVHRTVLLKDRDRSYVTFRWDKNLFRYLGTAIIISIMGLLVAFSAIAALMAVNIFVFHTSPEDASKLLNFAIAPFIVWLVWLRLALALPAAAIGVTGRLKLAWRSTRANFLRLLAIQVLVVLPFIVVNLPMVLLNIMAYAMNNDAASSFLQEIHPVLPAIKILISAIGALTVPFIATSLSLCYDFLVRRRGLIKP
jgi:hypothetical protein